MVAVNLESTNLLFERLTTKFCSQNYVDWMNDEQVIKYLESGGNYSKEKLYKFLLDQEKKDILFWAIIEKLTNKHIGNIKIDPLDMKNKSGEYGIMIGDKSVWGNGYGKEASIKVIDYCFNEFGLEQITLGVLSENKRAIRVYKSLGFNVYEVKRRENDNRKETFRMKLLKK